MPSVHMQVFRLQFILCYMILIRLLGHSVWIFFTKEKTFGPNHHVLCPF